MAPAKRDSHTKRPYHHGNLRASLLSAAWDIVGEEGVEGLSLRACARRANVSHAAPEHHFAGIGELIAEFAADGYERMAETMDEVAREHAEQPLLAAGLGYIKFATTYPKHFRVMSNVAAASVNSRRLQAATLAIRFRLETALQATYQAVHGRELTADELEAKTALAWCCVHGYVTILTDHLARDVRLPAASEILAQLRPALLS